MSKLFLVPVIFLAISCKAQLQPNPPATNILPGDSIFTGKSYNGEFEVYSNGLIYSPHTMAQLTHIVDSLNLRFKRCDLSKPYFSMRQGTANFIETDEKTAKAALADIRAGISYEAFVKKYPKAKKQEQLLTLMDTYENEGKWYTRFSGVSIEGYSDPGIVIEAGDLMPAVPLQNRWIYEKDTKYGFSAVYLTAEPVAAPLPEKYARMLLYADCVVDTSTDISLVSRDDTDYFGRDPSFEKGYSKTKLYAFLHYLQEQTKHITARQLPAGYKDLQWLGIDSMKKALVHYELSRTEKFKQLLADAVKEYREKNTGSSDEFEYYVALYQSKPLALQMKRSRRVVGMCSQDQAPRYHALNIAMLSAETLNWETFLRAHLNIMNDRFERMTDGSYAYAGRKTYIRELEELNIDVNDLMFGISLRSSNTASKHYYGSINRLGRAIAETKNSSLMESAMVDAIKDSSLDTYNRFLVFRLFENYSFYLHEKDQRLAAYAKLKEVLTSLPPGIRDRIKLEKEIFEKGYQGW